MPTSAKCWNSKKLHHEWQKHLQKWRLRAAVWSGAHLATVKPKWSHPVLLIGDRLGAPLRSSGQISMERCFSKQTTGVWTSLTGLTHLDGIGLHVCHNPENKQADPPASTRGAHFRSTQPRSSVPFLLGHQILSDKESCQAGAESKSRLAESTCFKMRLKRKQTVEIECICWI